MTATVARDGGVVVVITYQGEKFEADIQGDDFASLPDQVVADSNAEMGRGGQVKSAPNPCEHLS